jgi:hypothetical protein
MATPAAIARYHPFCSRNPVTTWEEGHAYELEIGSDRWPVSHVRWELVATGTEESELTISIWPSAFVGYPAALRSALHRWFLAPLLRRYLSAVLRGLDYYVTTGHDVAPNQFGRVWLFSYRLPRPALLNLELNGW